MLDAFMQATAMTISDARTLLAKFGIGAAEVDPADGVAVTRRADPRRCWRC